MGQGTRWAKLDFWSLSFYTNTGWCFSTCSTHLKNISQRVQSRVGLSFCSTNIYSYALGSWQETQTPRAMLREVWASKSAHTFEP